jgi:hypothetical protein
VTSGPAGIRTQKQWVFDQPTPRLRVSLFLPPGVSIEGWDSSDLQLYRAGANGPKGQVWSFDAIKDGSTARFQWKRADGTSQEGNLLVQVGKAPPPPPSPEPKANAPQVVELKLRILDGAGIETGSRVKWKLDARNEKLKLGDEAPLPIGKLGVLAQGSGFRKPVRIDRWQADTREGEVLVVQGGSGASLNPGLGASLVYRSNAVDESASKTTKGAASRRRAGPRLGNWALYAGVASASYIEAFRPGLSAWYVSLAGWADRSLSESDVWNLRFEANADALPITSTLDQAIEGEESTFARFIRANASVSARVARFGDEWQAFVRPGLSYSTMVVSNPQFGYFNLSGPALGVSVQQVPRVGRKIYLDATFELMNVTTASFDFGDIGFDVRAASSITQWGFGELDAFVRYRSASLEITGVAISQSILDFGLGYRW